MNTLDGAFLDLVGRMTASGKPMSGPEHPTWARSGPEWVAPRNVRCWHKADLRRMSALGVKAASRMRRWLKAQGSFTSRATPGRARAHRTRLRQSGRALGGMPACSSTFSPGRGSSTSDVRGRYKAGSLGTDLNGTRSQRLNSEHSALAHLAR